MDDEQRTVRKVEDEWVEVPAELADGSGMVTEPIKLRPGTDDDCLRINFADGEVGREIKITDLRRGVTLVEGTA